MTVDPRTLAADMRDMLPETWPRLHRDAADAIDILVPLHDAWLQAKPPCPRCGGAKTCGSPYLHDSHPVVCVGRAAGDYTCSGGLRCTDCSDGVLPFDKWTAGLVALWTRVHSSNDYNGIHLLDELRQIGGTR